MVSQQKSLLKNRQISKGVCMFLKVFERFDAW